MGYVGKTFGRKETRCNENIETSNHLRLFPHRAQGSTSLAAPDVAVAEEEARLCIPHTRPHHRTQGRSLAAQAHSMEVVFAAGDEDWAQPGPDTRHVGRSSRSHCADTGWEQGTRAGWVQGTHVGWEQRIPVGLSGIGNYRTQGRRADRSFHHRCNMSVPQTRDGLSDIVNVKREPLRKSGASGHPRREPDTRPAVGTLLATG